MKAQTEATWRRDENVLTIHRAGKKILPTADQVYACIFEKVSPWPDVPAGVSGDALILKFCRYPADAGLVIRNDGKSELPRAIPTVFPQSDPPFPTTFEALRIGHVIEGNTWYPLSASSLEEINSLLKTCEVDESGVVSAFRGLLHLKQAATKNECIEDHTSHDQELTCGYISSNVGEPSGITATLFPYQLDGWRWVGFLIKERLGGLLADEMGLGKTLQVISALNDDGDGAKTSKALIVAPSSLLENWKREFNKFCPSTTVLKHQGPARTGSPKALESFDVTIASYDTIVRDLPLFRMLHWDVVVLDEAQNIKNPDAQRTVAVKKLRRSASIAMTGTPVENRLTDLWSIIDFALPQYLGSLEDFDVSPEQQVDLAREIEPLVSPVMLRRRVSQVAKDLPPRVDIPELVDLSSEEAHAYEECRKQIREEHGNAATLVSLTKLRQFCSHPALVKEGDLPNPDFSFSKFTRLLEIIEEIFLVGEKCLVFSSFTKMADMIASSIASRFNKRAFVLDGRTPVEERQAMIDDFSIHRDAAVMILNPRAGGSGLNITAANHVIHYNLEWNPALEDQASARAHRRGQTRPVMVHRLICTGTVEETIEERVLRKRAIADSAIVGTQGNFKAFDDLAAALDRSPFALE